MLKGTIVKGNVISYSFFLLGFVCRHSSSIRMAAHFI